MKAVVTATTNCSNREVREPVYNHLLTQAEHIYSLEGGLLHSFQDNLTAAFKFCILSVRCLHQHVLMAIAAHALSMGDSLKVSVHFLYISSFNICY